jgi:hypothetical protein
MKREVSKLSTEWQVLTNRKCVATNIFCCNKGVLAVILAFHSATGAPCGMGSKDPTAFVYTVGEIHA